MRSWGLTGGVSEVRAASQQNADVAVLGLSEPIPEGVRPARLGRPAAAALVGDAWWAHGYGDAIGNDAYGEVGGVGGHGWIRIDGYSRYSVAPGFSGTGLWSSRYRAVVALVGQNLNTDGRCFTLATAAKALPGEGLGLLIDAWSTEQAGADAAAAWGWQLGADEEGRRHWRPRSRGVTSDAEQGYRFTGRAAALGEITRWLAEATVAPQALVVTGSPGVGKSAVLGRIVTTADPAIAAELPAHDHAVRAPVGSVACAVHAKGKTALEVANEIARAASAPLVADLEDLLPRLRETLAEHAAEASAVGGPARVPTVVLDALDEASSPGEARAIVGKVLRPLAETCHDLGVRVLVGARRRDDEGDLLASFGPAQRRIDLDEPEYFAFADLRDYALATLQG